MNGYEDLTVTNETLLSTNRALMEALRARDEEILRLKRALNTLSRMPRDPALDELPAPAEAAMADTDDDQENYQTPVRGRARRLLNV